MIATMVAAGIMERMIAVVVLFLVLVVVVVDTSPISLFALQRHAHFGQGGWIRNAFVGCLVFRRDATPRQGTAKRRSHGCGSGVVIGVLLQLFLCTTNNDVDGNLRVNQ